MQTIDLCQERRDLILEELRRNGKVVAAELSERYGVSEDTIRRDLGELAAARLLKRVHGGALPLTPAVDVFSLELVDMPDPDQAVFTAECGKGTYVRTLCHDIGEKLGCGACLKALRRTRSGWLDVADALPLDQILSLDRDALAAHIISLPRYLSQPQV